MNPHIRIIVARINGLTTEIKRTKANTKLHHWKKQQTLAKLKLEARHTMLAYAFIRRIPYYAVESKCNEKPYLYLLKRIITGLGVGRKAYGTYFSYDWLSLLSRDELDKELTEWLSTPKPTPVFQPASEPTFIQSAINTLKQIVGAQ